MADQSPTKTYQFATQDPHQPVQWWFQQAPEGLVLFVVFYTKACRWGRCLACNLPSQSSAGAVSHRAIMDQVDAVFEQAEAVIEQRHTISKLILSNNGSMFDEDTMPTTALMYLLAQANRWFPNLRSIALESRPEYVDWDELAIVARLAKEGDTPTQIELGIGFEAFDTRVRNQIFAKGLSLAVFEDLVDRLAEVGLSLSCYFMLKPVPAVTTAAAVADIHQAIAYLSAQSARSGVPITMHLNPTYVATGTPLEPAFASGTYQPPSLSDVAAAIAPAADTTLSVVIGLSDEGLAVAGGSFRYPGDASLAQAFERFNTDQDFAALAAAAAASGVPQTC